MKKLLFMGGLRAGGAEHQMVVVSKLLKRRGYDVSYLCAGSEEFYQKELEEDNIPIYRIKDNLLIRLLKLTSYNIKSKSEKILREGKFDTVISFLSFWNYVNCYFASKPGTEHRAITGIRNNRKEVFLSKSGRYYTQFEKYAYRKVSNSDSAKNVFSKLFSEFSDKLMTIYNIVDMPDITSIYECCRNGRVHIIVPASYRKVKNPMGLLHAAILLSEKTKNKLHIDWYGNIADGKECYYEMYSFIDKNGLSEMITLHDATTDIANRINEADAVGLFSTSEGLPNSICEGMMLNKPIIMTRVSDYEVLAGQGNGFLCDADSPETIAKVLSDLTQLSKDELLSMGAKSKDIACSHFTAESVLKKWEEII